MERVEAVQAAKQYAKEVFGDEDISRIRLEEINYDAVKDEWRITVGFTYQRAPTRLDKNLGIERIYGNRQYKVVHIRDSDGEFVGLTDRMLASLA